MLLIILLILEDFFVCLLQRKKTFFIVDKDIFDFGESLFGLNNMDTLFLTLFVLLIIQGILSAWMNWKVFFPKGEKKYQQYISKSFGNDYYKEHKKLVDSEVLANLLKKEK